MKYHKLQSTYITKEEVNDGWKSFSPRDIFFLNLNLNLNLSQEA
jgi:hypothetical protein